MLPLQRRCGILFIAWLITLVAPDRSGGDSWVDPMVGALASFTVRF